SRYGNAVYKVTVLGQSAHSANSPDTGRNAIVLMSRIISNLTEANTPSAIITPGIISGGTSVNTVPERAEVDFDIRALSEDDFKDIDKRFTEIVHRYSSGGYRVEVSCESKNPPFKKSDTSLELFKQLNRSASTAGSSFNLNTEALRGGSDANIISACGVPTLDGLGPYGEGAHTHEEFVFIPSIQEKVMSVSLFLANHLKL
ncbi:MAG: M20/M25/M40 family metallo-hydrolase, partial [Candidatus Dadabacteria bacterium]